MNLIAYLTFDGQGEAALNAYRRIFNAEIKTITRFNEAPFDVPPEYSNRVMIAEVEFQGIQLNISDLAPNRYDLQVGNHVALMLNDTDEDKMRAIFEGLADNGRVIEPLEATFWGTIFGMVTDQFGITWKFNVISTPTSNYSAIAR